MSDSPLFIYGLLATAPVMLVILLLRIHVYTSSLTRGLAYIFSLDALSFIIILLMAFWYIKLYQPGLSVLLLPMELIGLVFSVAWFMMHLGLVRGGRT
ncbi:hypothetical protein B7L70_00970 [Vulcanisaeta sp. EB80]|nr:hypothetical protein B7L70_00970 [Vulcanisaeta sp. EB80]